ncbi:MAG: RDD family protein, partial [Bryobacteraceae bacterium]
MEWYYADGGTRLGPVDDAAFEALQVSGKIRAETLVWKSGMAEWQPLNTIQAPVRAGDGDLSTEAFCTQCGRKFPPGDLLSYGSSRVCAGCKDVFFQRLREQGASAVLPYGARRYGGFWMRFLARIIDGLILAVVFTPLSIFVFAFAGRGIIPQPGSQPDLSRLGPFMGVVLGFSAVEILLMALYEAWFVSNRFGTPGKLVLGLKIIRPNGDKLSFGRALGRFILYYFGFILLG